jgi:hypothetical protein
LHIISDPSNPLQTPFRPPHRHSAALTFARLADGKISVTYCRVGEVPGSFRQGVFELSSGPGARDFTEYLGAEWDPVRALNK